MFDLTAYYMAFFLLPTLHNWFLRYVRSGTPLIAKLQKLHSSPLDSLCVLCASLGNEFSYLLLLPFVAWNLDMAVGRKLIVLWGIGLYIANYLKDLLLLPRPCELSNDVLNLLPGASRYSSHGLPCSRTFSATALPLYLVLLTLKTHDVSLVRAVVLAVSWCLLVSCSRVYLGLHSPTDIMAGGLLGLLLVWVGLTFGDRIDAVVAGPGSRAWLPLLWPVIAWMLLLAYPAPLNGSPVFAETAMVGGFTTGTAMGSVWFLQDIVGASWRGSCPSRSLCSTTDCLWLMGARSAVGLVLLVATHVIAVRFFLSILPPLDCFTPQRTYTAARIMRFSALNHHLGFGHHHTRASHLSPPGQFKPVGHGVDSSHHQYPYAIGLCKAMNGTSASHDRDVGNSSKKGQGTNGKGGGLSWHMSHLSSAAAGTQHPLGLLSEAGGRKAVQELGYEVIVPVLFCAYVCVGFNVTFTVPLVLRFTALLA